MIDIDSLGMLKLLKSKDLHRNPLIPDISKAKVENDNDNEDANNDTNDELLYGNSLTLKQ